MNTSLAIAKRQAKKYSQQYGTFWYVVETKPGIYQAYAHERHENDAVHTYFCGREWNEE